MISLDQVRLLESRIGKALEYIERLRSENSSLRTRLSGYEKKIEDLEVLVGEFKKDQGRIEDGILSALQRLNRFEDALIGQNEAGNKEREESPKVERMTAPDLSDQANSVPDKPEAAETDALENEAGEEAPAAKAKDEIVQVRVEVEEIESEDDEELKLEDESQAQAQKPNPQTGELDIF